MKKLLTYSTVFALAFFGLSAPANASTAAISESVFKITPEGSFAGLNWNYDSNASFYIPSTVLDSQSFLGFFGTVQISDSDISSTVSRRLSHYSNFSDCSGVATNPTKTISVDTADKVEFDCLPVIDTLGTADIESKTVTTFEGSFVRLQVSVRLVNPGNQEIDVRVESGGESGWSLASSGTGTHGQWEVYEDGEQASYGVRSNDSFSTNATTNGFFDHVLDNSVTITDSFTEILDFEFFVSPTIPDSPMSGFAVGDFGAKIPSLETPIDENYQDLAMCDGSSFGTSSSPEPISSVEDLYELELINLATSIMCSSDVLPLVMHVKMTEDLDLQGLDWNPLDLGDSDVYLYGNNHSISGLNINRPLQSNVGFIGSSNQVEIYSVHFRIGSVAGDNDVGAIIGDVYYFDLYDSTVVVDSVSSNGSDLGGLAGYVDEDGGVTSSNVFIGTVGSVDPANPVSDVGGLFGDISDDDFDLYDSYVSVESVSGSFEVGGLVGFLDDDADIFASAINIGQVSGNQYVGGLIGQIDDDINDLEDSSIRVGQVKVADVPAGEDPLVGIIAGGSTSSDNMDIFDSFVSGDVILENGPAAAGFKIAALTGWEDGMLDSDVNRSFFDLGVFADSEITSSLKPEYEAVAIGALNEFVDFDDSTLIFETDAQRAAPLDIQDIDGWELGVRRSSIDFQHNIYGSSADTVSAGITIDDQGESVSIDGVSLRYEPVITPLAGSGSFDLNLLADYTIRRSPTDVAYQIVGDESVNVQSDPEILEQSDGDFLDPEAHPAFADWPTSSFYLDEWSLDNGEKFFFQNCPGFDVLISTTAVPECNPFAALPSSKTVQVSKGSETELNVFQTVRFPVSMSGPLPLGLVLDPKTGNITGKLHPKADLGSVDLTFNHPTGERVMRLHFSTQPFSAPVPFDGPIITDVSATGEYLTITGERLETVEALSVDGAELEIVSKTENLITALAVNLSAGEKTLNVDHQQGLIQVQFQMLLNQSVADESATTNFWTTQISDTEIKFYAKNIVGAGKVQFFHNGNEVAWVNAEDDSDTKLRVISEGPMTGANYLVRTREMVSGKNVFEVYVDGERVLRRAQGN